MLIEKPIAESVEDARRDRRGRRARKGLVASVNHSLLYDPQVEARARRGALRRARQIVSASTSCAAPSTRRTRVARLPPLVSRRRLSVPRHRRPLPVPDPGAARPDRGRRGRVAQPRRRPEPRVRRVARPRALQARPRAVPADVEREADAVPADHPRHRGRAARRSVRDVPRQAQQRRRCPRRPSAWSTRSPIRSSRSSTCRSACGSSCARRSRRIRACAISWPTSTAGSTPGKPPPVSVDDAAEVVRWVEKVARAADADHASAARRVHALRAGRRSSSPAPRARSAARSSSACSPRARRVRVFVRRIPEKPIDGVEYCFGNLGDPVAVDRAVAGRRACHPLSAPR